jgi:membrane protein DedA with SNARE-associated domain
MVDQYAIQGVVEQFSYAGIFIALLLASIGVPIPEEAVVVTAGVLSQQGTTRWWIALPICIIGVLSGDVILYWAGWHWGERLLNWWVVRLVLTPEREERLKAAYHRHAVKTVFTARHIMGLRAAAFLTAGIARVPFWKFFAVDSGSALVTVPLGFTLAYFFADQLEEVLRDVRRTERWIGLGIAVVGAIALALWAWRGREQVDELAKDDDAGDEDDPARKRANGLGRKRAS